MKKKQIDKVNEQERPWGYDRFGDLGRKPVKLDWNTDPYLFPIYQRFSGMTEEHHEMFVSTFQDWKDLVINVLSIPIDSIAKNHKYKDLPCLMFGLSQMARLTGEWYSWFKIPEELEEAFVDLEALASYLFETFRRKFPKSMRDSYRAETMDCRRAVVRAWWAIEQTIYPQGGFPALKKSEAKILLAIWELDKGVEIKQDQIAAKVFLDRSTISPLLKNLIKIGMISEDGYLLTDLGRRWCEIYSVKQIQQSQQ